MREVIRIFYVIILLPLMFGACVSLSPKDGAYVSIHSLRSDPGKFSHKTVTVSGFLDVNVLET